MLIVLSPAKKLDFESEFQAEPALRGHLSSPELLRETRRLVKVAKTLKSEDLKAMMGVSDDIADLNVARFKAFKTPFTEANARPAIDAFKGDVYVGLDAEGMSAEDRVFAQDHVRILSGLYGVLRPLDLMQAYRLEMGNRFQNERGANLYQFWDKRITEKLNAVFDKEEEKTPVLINLASTEYFKAVKKKDLKAKVITPVFKDIKDGKARVVSFFAKKARGMMARYAIDHRITDAEKLKDFNGDGYKFDAASSTADQWVFTRIQPPPVKA